MKWLALVVGCVSAQLSAQVPAGKVWPNPPSFTLNGGNAVKLSGTVSDLTVGPAVVEGAYQAIYTSSDTAVVRNLKVQGVTFTNLGREGIRIRGDTDGAEISRFSIAMRAAPQTGDQLPTGIAIYRGKNIWIHDGRVSGFRMEVVAGKYTNGDGIASEGSVSNLTIERVEAVDNSDGGFDLKGTNITVRGLYAGGNSRNYRFWGDVNATDLTCGEARSGCMWIGKGARVHIGKLTVRQSTPKPIFILNGGTLTVDSCDIQTPPGTPTTRVESSPNVLTLGPGCRLDANGQPISG